MRLPRKLRSNISSAVYQARWRNSVRKLAIGVAVAALSGEQTEWLRTIKTLSLTSSC
jgi:hypothetical protein